jgi:hypothetical protein
MVQHLWRESNIATSNGSELAVVVLCGVGRRVGWMASLRAADNARAGGRRERESCCANYDAC